MTYAESCARWIEARWAVDWKWAGIDPPLDEMIRRVWVSTYMDDLRDNPRLTRALYDAIVRERGK